MSTTTEQVDYLRKLANEYGIESLCKALKDAARTIETLSAKHNEWLLFADQKPTENGEYIVQFDVDKVKIGEWRENNFVVDCWMIDKSRIVAWMPKPMLWKEEKDD